MLTELPRAPGYPHSAASCTARYPDIRGWEERSKQRGTASRLSHRA